MDVNNLGFGVMISMLSGNEDSANAVQSSIGKTITNIDMDTNDADIGGALSIMFNDGSGIKLFDDGQSCCERRYMVCDDDLPYFIGGTLVGVEVRDAPDAPAKYDYHEVQFLIVTTSKGAFTVSNHNEHNGYYGGFALRAKQITEVM